MLSTNAKWEKPKGDSKRTLKRGCGACTRGIHQGKKQNGPNPTPHPNTDSIAACKDLNKWPEIWKRKRKRKGAEKKVYHLCTA